MGRWLLVMLMATLGGVARGQVPEPDLPRPGIMVVAEITGDVSVNYGDQPARIKLDERLRPGAVLTTGRRSLVRVILSNGATIEVGSDSELEIEDFGQAPYSTTTIKIAEMKEEPSISRTRLRLLRGDVKVAVRPLKTARGSSLTLALLAGTIKTGHGVFNARLQMSDLGLGVCTLEVAEGSAQFEPVGGKFQAMPVGRKLGFALEVDRSGKVTLGEMPKPTAKGPR